MEEKNKKVKTAHGTGPVLSIATAPSRMTKRWKNTEITWADLLARFENPTRTQETYREYKALPKAEQGRIKDVGGFVLGALKEGKRKKGHVAMRSALTLDMDSMQTSLADFAEGLNMFQDFEGAIYTTHSHSTNQERARLVVPLSRPVTAEEYEAIARMLAKELDLSNFDPTTFEPERLMYWPSVSLDGDYAFYHIRGALLDPDEWLAKYTDWRDTSFWPGVTQYHEIKIGALKKQEDPLEKKGLIGAFCRTYSITDIIVKELSDIYSQASEDRWTFNEGSTMGGMIVYEDKFAYSHHATDPISGQLVNAFDFLRLHKFGHLDEEAHENTGVTNLPSFMKMSEYATQDPLVKTRLIKEMGDIEEELDFDEADWHVRLEVDSKGIPKKTVYNCQLVLENHEDLKGKYYFDAFANRAVVTGELPWQSGKDRDWNDTDDAGLRGMLEKTYGITGVQKVIDAISLAFEKNKVHPVKEYLESLTWDGIERVPTILTDYLGVESSDYVQEVSRIHLTAAVARIMRPGTKYDTMLTLIGKQGLGKSTFIRILCGNAWFNDSIERINGKETFELLQGSWHVELGELNATKKAEKESVKQFLSKTEDIYRTPYGRRTTRYPRQCVFWGTGNEVEFLRDETGDRRYFPVTCHEVTPTKSVFKDLAGERDQIWAEAVQLWKSGQQLFLNPVLELVANEIRKQHKEDRPKVGMVAAFLERPIPVDWYQRSKAEKLAWVAETDGVEDIFFDTSVETTERDRVCVAEVWEIVFGNDLGKMRPIDAREIGEILRSIDGWEQYGKSMRFGEYGVQKGYIKSV